MPQQAEIPPRAVPDSDNAYFEVLTKVIFQTGFRWSVVEDKWPGFREAFAGFDIDEVAGFDPTRVDDLGSDPRIVRNGRKIKATVDNAVTLKKLIGDYGSVREWLATTSELAWPERRKAVAAPFKQLGPSGAYHFLWCVGEPVPPHEERDTWSGPVPASSPESR